MLNADTVLIVSWSYFGDCFIALVNRATGNVLALSDGYAVEELPDCSDAKMPVYCNLKEARV